MPDQDESAYTGPRPTATQRNTDRSIPAILARWRDVASWQPRSNLDYARIGEQAHADVGPLLDELGRAHARIAELEQQIAERDEAEPRIAEPEAPTIGPRRQGGGR